MDSIHCSETERPIRMRENHDPLLRYNRKLCYPMPYNFGTFLNGYFYTLVGDELLPFSSSTIDNAWPVVSLLEVTKATCCI